MKPETSIIIRTRNEEKWIGAVIERLQQQTYQDFEIIVVDSGSTDNTVQIANNHSVQVVHIQPEDFTYPSAINTGIKNSSATKYFVILSAHSLPIGHKWLESAISKFSQHEHVLGVYGPLKALPGSTIWDNLFHGSSYLLTKLKMLPKAYAVIEKDGMGVLGFTNAIIRKDLWEQYPINESFAGGGEDNDWAKHWMSHKYVAVKDLGFTVMHSHNLNFSEWKAQLAHWKELSIPRPFKHLPFRKDGAHQEINDS